MTRFLPWLLFQETGDDDIVSYLLSGSPQSQDREFARKMAAQKNPAEILNKLRRLRTRYGTQIQRAKQQVADRLKTTIQRDLQGV